MSKKWRLNTNDYEKQLKSALIWLAPLALVYLGQLGVTLKSNGVLKLTDFALDQVTVGSLQLYVVNQLYGLFNKLKNGKTA